MLFHPPILPPILPSIYLSIHSFLRSQGSLDSNPHDTHCHSLEPAFHAGSWSLWRTCTLLTGSLKKRITSKQSRVPGWDSEAKECEQKPDVSLEANLSFGGALCSRFNIPSTPPLFWKSSLFLLTFNTTL